MSLTVQQARELLRDEAVGMTDSQVEDLVALVDGLADIIIDTYISEHRRSAPAGKSDRPRRTVLDCAIGLRSNEHDHGRDNQAILGPNRREGRQDHR